MRGIMKAVATLLVLGIVAGAVYASAVSSAHRESEDTVNLVRDWLNQRSEAQVRMLQYDRDTLGGEIRYDIELTADEDSPLYAPLVLLTGDEETPQYRLQGTIDLRFGPWIPEHGFAAMLGEENIPWRDGFTDALENGPGADDRFAQLVIKRELGGATDISLTVDDVDLRLKDGGDRLSWSGVGTALRLSAARRTLDYHGHLDQLKLDGPALRLAVDSAGFEGRSERTDLGWQGRLFQWHLGHLDLLDTSDELHLELDGGHGRAGVERVDGLDQVDLKLGIDRLSYQNQPLGGLEFAVLMQRVDSEAARLLVEGQHQAPDPEARSSAEEQAIRDALRRFHEAGPRFEDGRLALTDGESALLELRFNGEINGHRIAELPADTGREELDRQVLEAASFSARGELSANAYSHLARLLVLANDPLGETARDSDQLASEAALYQVIIEMTALQMPFILRLDDGGLGLDVSLRDGWLLSGDERFARLEDLLE
ncbi:YdgA family protein [Methylonatrum kenyense]|uniref:DUF945 family protein n=1 Tax=Methylonatrum kenyense TaxID=455253 RepID=UPI0020BD6E1B|nr:DUF945 family protein [Methylonatrum kenyense]MCK8516701.1 YdgA family protein [Methylonatrum kenyense]